MRRIYREGLYKVTICDLKDSCSSTVSWNIKSESFDVPLYGLDKGAGFNPIHCRQRSNNVARIPSSRATSDKRRLPAVTNRTASNLNSLVKLRR
jgi:hypothetical protein